MDVLTTSGRDGREAAWSKRRGAASYWSGFRLVAERPLPFILALAFILRASSALLFSGAVDTEGAEYARIAENLLLGRGYVGIAAEGPQLFFPPLFPFAIAAASLLTGDVVIAGRAISVVMGSLMVAPVYFIALKMYDRRTAALAALLVACHPFLINMSTTLYCEMVYLTLVLTAICLAFSAIEHPTTGNLLASGAVYGLAYLVRPEAAACLLISAILILLAVLARKRAEAAATSARVGLMIGAFVLIAAPYVAWLSIQTGQFRIEGKSALNVAVERRIQQGETPQYAAFGVTVSGEERGVWNRPNLATMQSHSMGFSEFLTYLRQKTQWVVKNASEALASYLVFGSPPLFALAVLGLFARPWPFFLTIFQLHIFGVLALMVVGTYFIYFSNARFYVLAIPFYCIWGAVGLQHVASWATKTLSALRLPDRYRFRFNMSVAIVGVGAAAAFAVALAVARLESARAGRQIKAAGEWLAATSVEPVRLLDSRTVLSFHAKAAHFWLPCCDEKGVLSFIDKNNVNVVVVRPSDVESFPYLKDWVSNGVPHPRATLVKTLDLGASERIMIYRIES